MFSLKSFLLIAFFLINPSILLLAQDAIDLNSAFPAPKVRRNLKRHKVSIKRTFSNAVEEKLLQIAEMTYPVEEEVKSKCAARHGSRNELEPTGPRWWCKSFDGVFMPYSITRGAVEYYVTATDEFRSNNFTRTHKLRMMETDFVYSAAIHHRDKISIAEKVFMDVYEVSLSLSWSQYCGSLCAMGVSGKRRVVLNREGAVLFVAGDGEMQGIVS